MATLEQILEEAKKLPHEEQLRLRAALDAREELASNGNEKPSYRTHEKERAWIEAHRDEFLDQWVALDGDSLIAHGSVLARSTTTLEPKARPRPTLFT
jgi:hypothetical protein